MPSEEKRAEDKEGGPVEKSTRSEKADRSEKTEKAEKPEKSDKPDKADKGDRSERIEKPVRSDKVDKADKSTKESKGGSTAAAAPAGTASTTAPRVTSSSRAPPKAGLTEDALSQVAQAKFEAQEDKLKDVARFAMALLRDYPKLSSADCAKKVAEIRKCLMKYEMQYLRVCELQERRRRTEIKNLEAEATRCREEAETEASGIVALREALEKERRRRKRYEGYEQAAAEVNQKKSRTESQSDISNVTQQIAQLKQQHVDLDKKIEERTQRAQLLRQAAAELAADLRAERDASGLGVDGPGPSGSDSEEKAGNVSIAAVSTVELIS